MITPQDYEVFYYLPTLEYRVMGLDLPEDPNRRLNFNKALEFEKLFAGCPIDEYIKVWVLLFKDVYPNAAYLSCYTTKQSETLPRVDLPNRSDIKAIDFDFIENDDIYGTFLKRFSMTFMTLQSNIITIIASALQGKQFTQTQVGQITLFDIEDSPILKIEASQTSMTFYLNKAFYIDDYIFV